MITKQRTWIAAASSTEAEIRVVAFDDGSSFIKQISCGGYMLEFTVLFLPKQDFFWRHTALSPLTCHFCFLDANNVGVQWIEGLFNAAPERPDAIYVPGNDFHCDAWIFYRCLTCGGGHCSQTTMWSSGSKTEVVTGTSGSEFLHSSVIIFL